MRRVGRKLLVASLGVASVTYGACSSEVTKTDAAVDVARADTGSPDADGGADGAVDTQGGPDGTTDASVDRQFMGNLA